MYFYEVLWVEGNKSLWKISVLAVAIIGSLFCFLPLFINNSDVNIDGKNCASLDIAVNSYDFKYSVIASMAVGTKMLIDSAVNYFKYNNNSQQGIFELLLLISILLVVNIFFVNANFKNNLPLLHCIISARSIMRTCLALVYLDSSDNWFWKNKHTFNTILIYAIGTSLQNLSKFSRFSYELYWIAISFYIIALIELIIICKAWIIRLKEEFANQGWSYEFLFSCLHVPVCSIIVVSIIGLLLCHSYDWKAMNTMTLTSISYLELLFVVFLTTLQYKFLDVEMTTMKSSLETKRTFVRFVSHEIRTPLNTVSLGIDLLQSEIRKAGNFPELIEITNDLKSSGEIALTLVNDLLVYDKLEAGILKLELDHLPIWNVLLESIRPFQLQARQAEIELVLPSLPLSFATSCLLPYEIEDIIAIVDKSRIRQVVSNLISNALKFSPKHNSVIIDITFTPWSDEADSAPLLLPPLEEDSINEEYKGCKKMKMMLSVIDQGPGLSLENQNKLFKEIIQFNPGKLQAGGGSGLGLWISQRIATMHGGKLSVMSEGEGFGCTFTFKLPVYIKQQQCKKRTDLPSCSIIGDEPTMSTTSTTIKSCIKIPAQVSMDDFTNIITEDFCHHQIQHDKQQQKDGVPLKSTTPLTATESIDRLSSSVISSEDTVSYIHDPINTITESESVLQDFHILVVDDVPMNRKMICRVLQGKCRGTLEAEDGVVAVNLIKQRLLEAEAEKGEGQQGREGTGTRPIDVILMDYMMPIMNGPEATRLIRSLGYTGIIIGVTGNAQPAEVKEFLNAGANKILIKPMNLQSLVKSISSVI